MPSTVSYSIVLPTYNRAEFLPLAIQSILDQTFEDFELIISNGGSTDGTNEAVARFNDKRIRYFESLDRLTMAQNYEFALDQATGENVIFFSDDDALVPTALSIIEKVFKEGDTQMVVFPFAHYNHEQLNTQVRSVDKNTISFLPFTGAVTEVAADIALQRMFSVSALSKEPIDLRFIYPLIGNVACRRSMLDALRVRTTKLFQTVPVDIYFMTAVLSQTQSYKVVDAPLLVWSKWSENSSRTVKRDGSGVREHYERLLNGVTLDFVPLKFAMPLNCSANAVLKAMFDVGKLDTIIVDWQNYYHKNYDELEYFRSEGINVDAEISEIQSVLERESPIVLKEIRQLAKKPSRLIKRKIKANLLKLPGGNRLIRSFGRTANQEELTIVDGKELEFTNFLQASRKLSQLIETTNS